MSDNIDPDLIKKRLIIFLRIPSETWTDVLKMLPRRILVKNISSSCYRLKEISDKNVKNVHVIERPYMFTLSLQMKDPEAIQQLAHLTTNNCPLAGQFRMTDITIYQKCKDVLRHCSDLFEGCQISLSSHPWDGSSVLNEQCLDILEANKPTEIYITIYRKLDQFNSFWQHPTILNCSRIHLEITLKLSYSYANVIFQWLHHQPMETGVDGNGADEQPVRCLIFHSRYYGRGGRVRAINWLLDHCLQNLQESQGPTDRRRFVLSFSDLSFDEIENLDLDEFGRHENRKTGEVLLLETAGEWIYRLRRCLAEEADKGEGFYAKIFDREDGQDYFLVNDAPMVEIQNYDG